MALVLVELTAVLLLKEVEVTKDHSLVPQAAYTIVNQFLEKITDYLDLALVKLLFLYYAA